MKLAKLPLKGLEWDEKIPELDQTRWNEILTTFVELNNIQMPRCCIPSSEESVSKIRLIYKSDAVKQWSCDLCRKKIKNQENGHLLF